ncbi:MAG: hypothetical protein P8K68_02805 [Algibacter sp.]|uniref:hypothetical protein n=1 Tax=Algibacter sp. TaxID=1872428 RepID=UPI00262DC8B9|nr:hypothetical protein [Algibacter sp.]MDG1729557.1 hypothetical protein [Algibacter sp.]MDG2177699.1 hypothetical protein [Algibacter sp.]
MKTIKSILILALFLCFTFNITQAQQAYLIHQDNVKPSKIMQYEKIAKAFNAACVKHNVQSTWSAASTNDLKYYYITPIENMADVDKRPMADMAEAMGDDFGKMFEEFDTCYDTHGSYIILRDSKLSYMPEGVAEAPEGENYRKWFYMYYTPENAKAMREGMKAVKEFFAAKGSKEYYRVYRNGFGQMENFYMVSVSAKNEIDSATRGKANEDVLGPDRWDVFNKVMEYTTRMEELSGEMRPDLSYSPK